MPLQLNCKTLKSSSLLADGLGFLGLVCDGKMLLAGDCKAETAALALVVLENVVSTVLDVVGACAARRADVDGCTG